MKTYRFLIGLLSLTSLLTGCFSPPPAEPVPTPVDPEPVVVQPEPAPIQVLGEMQQLAATMTDAGGLAAIGVSQSKSLDLAMNMAKKNGRIELARILHARIEAVTKAFAAEAGIPYDSLLLSGFNAAEQTLVQQYIVGSLAQVMKYEAIGDSYAAYALVELHPQLILDQLKKEEDLYSRLQPTQAFQDFSSQVARYETFKSAQQRRTTETLSP
ncbi:MAG: hypothetical protein FJ220_04255 [Kiritimatiellaceae bacterium]|nr:hypothetical protein [Kiritimatiellaceae bacterium]